MTEQEFNALLDESVQMYLDNKLTLVEVLDEYDRLNSIYHSDHIGM